ncbi:magnesium and cobalt efflux protein CorC [Spirochaetota bacterium]|nr:magnesium and cobalt efflux protein CorC [Spirochaetota bacterium]
MNWYSLVKKTHSTIEINSATKTIRRLFKKNLIDYKQFSTIINVLESRDLCARDIMLPRVDVIAIDINSHFKALQRLIARTTHSRFPVYNSNIDDIKGILHIKDIFSYFYEKNEKQKQAHIKKHLTQPFFIPESRKIFDILKDFQHKHQQMAVVVDEYGGFSGIVTMEDVLEEIIGDIKDESDNEKETVIKLAANKFSIDARADLETINDITGLTLESDKAETLGGYIIDLLGYVPKLGAIVSSDEVHFKVKHKRGNSLIRIHVKLPEQNQKKNHKSHAPAKSSTKER